MFAESLYDDLEPWEDNGRQLVHRRLGYQLEHYYGRGCLELQGTNGKRIASHWTPRGKGLVWRAIRHRIDRIRALKVQNEQLRSAEALLK